MPGSPIFFAAIYSTPDFRSDLPVQTLLFPDRTPPSLIWRPFSEEIHTVIRDDKFSLNRYHHEITTIVYKAAIRNFTELRYAANKTTRHFIDKAEGQQLVTDV